VHSQDATYKQNRQEKTYQNSVESINACLLTTSHKLDQQYVFRCQHEQEPMQTLANTRGSQIVWLSFPTRPLCNPHHQSAMA